MIPIFKPTLGKEELEEIKESFDSHWIGLGPKTKKFEEEFKKYIEAKNAISLNSGTAALHLSLIASGIKEGDEVLIPSMTFASTGHAVLFCRAKPILVDVDRETLLMDTNDLKKKINPKTKAIIAVHYGGHICDMDKIISIAKEKGISLIEDAANCAGAEYKGKKIGNLDSDFTCFSFEAKKNMTTGDGGMLTTNKEGRMIDKIRSLRWVGMDKDTLKRFSGKRKPWEYDIIELGYKYNMNDIAASIGIAQLKKLDDMNDKKRKILEKYNKVFKDLKWLKTPVDKDYAKNAYWLYILRVEEGDRNKLMEYLLKKGIQTTTNFKPLHLFSFYKDYYQKNGITVKCPVAEEEWKKVVVLPLYPTMTDEEFNKIVESVKNYKNEDN
ncbi:MAG: DegT/DnrJ/EryC1/StrS family aminotransferase [Nanoarchaeota archaeon]|nr:DegT/DnrJ/EryC1/StrS family aminotransferase [Nanoarchaeota archaeon]